MPARPIWRGYLRLALASCPVALWNARHDRAGIRFNLINPDTGNKIKMVTSDDETGKELELPDLVKGCEFRKNQYLLGFRQRQGRELIGDDGREVRATGSIDPVYYDAPYFLAPDGDAGRDVYAGLREAIAKTSIPTLSRMVIAQRERTCAPRATG